MEKPALWAEVPALDLHDVFSHPLCPEALLAAHPDLAEYPVSLVLANSGLSLEVRRRYFVTCQVGLKWSRYTRGVDPRPLGADFLDLLRRAGFPPEAPLGRRLSAATLTEEETRTLAAYSPVCHQLANLQPRCAPELVVVEAQSPEEGRRAFAAAHPRLPLEWLEPLALDASWEVKRGVIRNPQVAPGLLLRLAAQHPELHSELAQAPTLPASLLLDWAQHHKDPFVLEHVVVHPALPEEALPVLCRRPLPPQLIEKILRARALSPERWVELARHPSSQVRCLIASDPRIAAEALALLSADPDDLEVLKRVAAHAHTRPEDLSRLAGHDQPSVIEPALNNPNLPRDRATSGRARLQGIVAELAQAVGNDPLALSRLAASPWPAVRLVVAKNASTPVLALLSLLPTLRQQVLGNWYWLLTLDEPTLNNRFPMKDLVVAAEHPQCPPELLESDEAAREPGVVAALLRNEAFPLEARRRCFSRQAARLQGPAPGLGDLLGAEFVELHRRAGFRPGQDPAPAEALTEAEWQELVGWGPLGARLASEAGRRR